MNTEEPVQGVEDEPDKMLIYCTAVGGIPEEYVVENSTNQNKRLHPSRTNCPPPCTRRVRTLLPDREHTAIPDPGDL